MQHRQQEHSMDNVPLRWNELKTKFLREFTPSEQVFFLTKARECMNLKGYPASEDLFSYCYLLTILERLRLIDPSGCEGFMRLMLVQSQKEVRDEMKVYESRLEAMKRPAVHPSLRLIEYLAS
jgi:hypothetical protein